ncbi:response regulator transcription factor [Alloacidobacterium dinghuense]|uniref:Response regulator transcription factor n=1 Tax=Alloacidobacterium dinghuense TaxID=2763107 RepID=A0A7G8BGI5_9BACT|nr:response regulator transcription factor [Alloacidobacterium dinghuense]QNI31655.1 response regulator transcription factor [Alloacidobacterium dinghuense]
MFPDSRIRVLSVDDHPVFGAGLGVILSTEEDMILVAQASNAAEAIDAFRKHRPDITLMDLSLPDASGTDALIAIREEFPQARIIMLTTFDREAEIQRALRAGAAGYILKSLDRARLLNVIRSAHAGHRHVQPEVAARLAEHVGYEELTTREVEVLSFVRDGYRNKQIADRLAISENTVNFHVKNVMMKLGANDRTHAVTIAQRRGFLRI